MKEDIRQYITKEKKRLGRVLSDDEIARIIKDNKVPFFKKKKIVMEGKSGIDDVDYFYNICKSEDNALTGEKREFLLLSIDMMKKEAIEMADYIVECDYPITQLINNFNDYLMKLIYLEKICGIPIDEHQSYISAHEDLYNEILNNTKKRSI